MKLRVFIDTNVFIYAFEFPESNSCKIIDLLNKGLIEVIISERVLKETQAYFRKFYNKDRSDEFRFYLISSCTVIFPENVKNEISKYRNQIKDKDLEQLAVVKSLGIKFLIAYDRDFNNFEEYITPKAFIETMNLVSSSTNY